MKSFDFLVSTNISTTIYTAVTDHYEITSHVSDVGQNLHKLHKSKFKRIGWLRYDPFAAAIADYKIEHM